MNALKGKFVRFSEERLEFINKKASHVELVLTGRGASEKLIEKADLVSEMKKIDI